MALADDPSAWTYGYELCRQLDLKAGTVYPILIRLAERGHVETTWEARPEPGRPRRHLYRISAQGAELVESLSSGRAATSTTSPSLRTSAALE